MSLVDGVELHSRTDTRFTGIIILLLRVGLIFILEILGLSLLFFSRPVLFVDNTSPGGIASEEVLVYNRTNASLTAFDPKCDTS